MLGVDARACVAVCGGRKCSTERGALGVLTAARILGSLVEGASHAIMTAGCPWLLDMCHVCRVWHGGHWQQQGRPCGGFCGHVQG